MSQSEPIVDHCARMSTAALSPVEGTVNGWSLYIRLFVVSGSPPGAAPLFAGSSAAPDTAPERDSGAAGAPPLGLPDAFATTGRVDGFTCQRTAPLAPTSYTVSRWSSTVTAGSKAA